MTARSVSSSIRPARPPNYRGFARVFLGLGIGPVGHFGGTEVRHFLVRRL